MCILDTTRISIYGSHESICSNRSSKGSLDTLDSGEIQSAPHIFHGYDCLVSRDIVAGRESPPNILLGDLLVFFDAGTYLDEFWGDETEMDDIYGIAYGLVECNLEGAPVLVGHCGFPLDLEFHDFSEVTLSAKAYRLNQAGHWKSVLDQAKQPWQGWLDLHLCDFSLEVSHHAQHPSVIDFLSNRFPKVLRRNFHLWQLARSFIGTSFKPEYRSFVRKMRRWDRDFKTNLRLGNCLEAVTVISQEICVRQFVNDGPATLSCVMAYIGTSEKFGYYFEKRGLSLMFLLVKKVNDILVRP